MTHPPNDHDRELKDLFHKARRVESRGAPDFDALLQRSERSHPNSNRPLRLLAIGLSTAAIAALAVTGAFVALVPGHGRGDLTALIAANPAPPAQSPIPSEPSLWRLDAPDPALPEVPSRPLIKTMPPPPRPTVDKNLSSRNAAKRDYERLASEARARAGAEAKTETEEFTETVVVSGPVDVLALGTTSQTTKFSDENIQDLPVPGRFHQNVLTVAPGVGDADGDGNPNVHDSRTRDFKAEVGSVSNVAPLAGQRMNPVNPNSIEGIEVVTASAGVEFSRAQGGFARLAGEDRESELRARTEPWNAEGYRPIEDNPYLAVTENPLSTFSIDVDTASFSNVRRFLATGVLPPPDAVRIEELINYFDYDYPSPAGGAPFSTDVAIVDCPWNPAHRLARIGIKGHEVHPTEHAGGNLVFLIDVSGSMDHPSKLPLLQSALKLMVEQLTANDQVAIVVYAGSSGLVLDSTSGDAKAKILGAIDRLRAGGSTNGGAGLKLAYKIARENFVPGGVNRVILATDGDFNVGVTSHGGLLSSIEKDAKNGIFLTALGFGYGNYQDDRLEHLADKGNGNYAYIDRLREARKVLVDELAGTLITIAKDVKIQIEFNPREVGAYRLIGYENRLLAKEDFNDDRKDAGEIGAGHTVTALYELVPPGKVGDLPEVDELRYQTVTAPSEQADSGEAFTLKIRYKKPEGRKSHLLTFAIVDEGLTLEGSDDDVKFAAAVAQFGLLLRDSDHKGSASFGSVTELALKGTGADEHGYRAEFLEMVRKAESLVVDSKPAE